MVAEHLGQHTKALSSSQAAGGAISTARAAIDVSALDSSDDDGSDADPGPEAPPVPVPLAGGALARSFSFMHPSTQAMHTRAGPSLFLTACRKISGTWYFAVHDEQYIFPHRRLCHGARADANRGSIQNGQ